MLVTFTNVQSREKLLIDCPTIFSDRWWANNLIEFSHKYSDGGFKNVTCSHPVECQFVSGERLVRWRWDNPDGTPRRIS